MRRRRTRDERHRRERNRKRKGWTLRNRGRETDLHVETYSVLTLVCNYFLLFFQSSRCPLCHHMDVSMISVCLQRDDTKAYHSTLARTKRAPSHTSRHTFSTATTPDRHFPELSILRKTQAARLFSDIVRVSIASLSQLFAVVSLHHNSLKCFRGGPPTTSATLCTTGLEKHGSSYLVRATCPTKLNSVHQIESALRPSSVQNHPS